MTDHSSELGELKWNVLLQAEQTEEAAEEPQNSAEILFPSLETI